MGKEPKCHVDINFHFNLKNGGLLFSVFDKLEMYVCTEGMEWWGGGGGRLD